LVRNAVLGALVVAASSLFTCIDHASAQTIGYGEAIDRLAVRCGKDIAKFCRTVNLGGGRMQQCLAKAGVSAQCKATLAEVKVLLQKRADARAAVLRVCDVDIKTYCSGIQPGDGHLMECFMKAQSRMNAQCRRAVVDAGYE
jgi:hypothetical protein